MVNFQMTQWLSANVSCILKKGVKHAAEDYRPVSLTSVPCNCKLLEHIICGHMMKHLEKHNVLTSLNHGFRLHILKTGVEKILVWFTETYIKNIFVKLIFKTFTLEN
jgi:hypothetical protein